MHQADLHLLPSFNEIDVLRASSSLGSRLGRLSPVHFVRMTDPTIKRRALFLVVGFESTLVSTAALEPVSAATSRIPTS